MRDYCETLVEMQAHTEARRSGSGDEIWIVQHPRVYTLGQAGHEAHILAADGIPVVRSDRGGQVTYHGPGQLVVYVLIELKRWGLTVRGLVWRLEQAVITYLAEHSVAGVRRRGAPGVYVDERKIAALGLRIRRGCSYHGLSLNVDMELAPFLGIDPCGYPGLEVTQLRDLGIDVAVDTCSVRLVQLFIRSLREGPAQPPSSPTLAADRGPR